MLACFLALIPGDQMLASYSQAKQKIRQTQDAVWISIRNSRPTANNISDVYFDLERNGAILVFRKRVHSGTKGVPEVYTGVLPQSATRRIFQVITAPEVLNARDSELGEPIFSQSDWANVGALIGDKFKQAPLWGFTEELKDYPTQFQQVIDELKRFANNLPQNKSVKKLVSAALVDDRRANVIRNDPRRFYNILDLTEKDLFEIPALSQARTSLQRMIPIKSEKELQRLLSLMNASNLKGQGESFFLTISGRTYQIQLY